MRDALGAALKKIRTFRDRAVHAAIALVDWDHRLPSKALVARLHLCYDALAQERFEQAYQCRLADIEARNRFPEFDVPDFSGLLSDEVYDIELSAKFEFENMRFVSPWRRDISDEDASKAVEAVQASDQFADLKRSVTDRSGTLGDPEAVGWSPPCETGQSQWALDVWWLTSFDGRIGRGWSFLVDLARKDADPVIAAREFSVRAG